MVARRRRVALREDPGWLRPREATCGAAAHATPHPRSRCAAPCTLSAFDIAWGEPCSTGAGRTSRFRARASRCSSTGASGTDVRSTGHPGFGVPTQTGGRRKSRQTGSVTSGWTTSWSEPAGEWSGCGSARCAERQVRRHAGLLMWCVTRHVRAPFLRVRSPAVHPAGVPPLTNLPAAARQPGSAPLPAGAASRLGPSRGTSDFGRSTHRAGRTPVLGSAACAPVPLRAATVIGPPPGGPPVARRIGCGH